jgi:type VI secretion system protein VasJ
MQQDLEKLGQLLGELLPEAPSLQQLRGYLQRAAQSLGAYDHPIPGAGEAGKPEPVDAEASTVSRPQAAPVVPELTMAPFRDCREAVEEGLHRLQGIAALLLDQDPANPLAYRLSRHAAWLRVSELPPATAGRTLLPPPTTRLRERLAELRHGGDSTALLKVVELQLSQFIFWLDLNRLAAEALADRDAAQAAVAAVGQETAFLLQRLPGLDELAFADGTPFADADTREWLKRLLPGVKRRAVAPPPETVEPKSEPEGLIGREIDVARAMISEGKLIEAIERLLERLKNGSSGRERLRWRLALARVLMDEEQTRFALPHLEQVVSDIKTYRLSEYDPALALEGLTLAWQGFEPGPEPRFKEKADDALHRIARIDPAEMVRLVKGRESASCQHWRCSPDPAHRDRTQEVGIEG